jgi:hypothetical protein
MLEKPKVHTTYKKGWGDHLNGISEDRWLKITRTFKTTVGRLTRRRK